MFWRRFAPTPEVPARWQGPLQNLVGTLAQLPPGTTVDPSVLARRAKLTPAQALALLGVLQDRGQGRLAFRVIDRQGVEIGKRRYAHRDEIPDRVPDEFGDVTQVYPENIELIFEPAGAAAVAR